jgi:hypothetical protein
LTIASSIARTIGFSKLSEICKDVALPFEDAKPPIHQTHEGLENATSGAIGAPAHWGCLRTDPDSTRIPGYDRTFSF